MFRIRFLSTLSLLALISTLTACGGSGPQSSAHALCQRMQNCNNLRPGESVDDCTMTVSGVVSQGTKTEQQLVDEQIDRCANMSTCSAVISCINSL